MVHNTSSQAGEFESVVERCCGLDIHKVEIVATVDGEGIKKETRSFTSTTRSLTELKEWLLSLGITHIAMESTGVYWKPVFNILEPGGFTIMIVNARHIKYVPGHKTDKKDSAWICKLLKAGLLKGSFVPGQAQRDLRDLTRYRRKLVQSESAEHNRLIRVLEDANLKLSSVFSNETGKTCTMVIDEILKVVYHMLKDGTAYKELGTGFIDDRRKNAVIHYHKEALKQLGVELPEKVTV